MKVYLLFFTLLFSSTTLAEDKYKIIMNESGSGNWGAIRFNPETGQSWMVKGGIFVEMLEQELPGKSEYIIEMAKTRNTWGAIRMDVKSGKSWYYKDKMWTKILESN